MKILVAGGAGFIGSHIVDAYVGAGHQVTVVDDLSTGNLEWLNPKAKFHRFDIRNPKLTAVFEREQPQLVSHQAARMNVRESMRDPLLYASVNVLGSLNLLECCRKYGVKKFIYASTGGAVYGEPVSLPVTEEHPIRPLDPYGVSKYTVEQYLYLYHQHFGIDYVAFRYPNVYGPRQSPHGESGVIVIFLRQMLDGAQPVISGDGEQQRDFVFVEDIVRANMYVLDSDAQGVFNTGSGIGTSINQIYEHLVEVTGYKGEKKHGPQQQGEVKKIFLNSAKIRGELGWISAVGLEEGLKTLL
jgi:UDP-glucose 4-epimerase